MTVDELMQLEPGLIALYIVFAYLLTAVVFSIIPLLIAFLKKKKITRKGYSIVCYIANLPIMIADSILYAGNLKLTPYLIWTCFAIWIGLKILKKRGTFNPY